MAAAKLLCELSGRSRAWLVTLPLGSSTRQFCNLSAPCGDALSQTCGPPPSVVPRGFSSDHYFRSASPLHCHHARKLNPLLGMSAKTRTTTTRRESAAGCRQRNQVVTQGAPMYPVLPRLCDTRNNYKQIGLLSTLPEKPKDNKKEENKSFGKGVVSLLAGLDKAPLAALGLGLAGAIPFVGLTPGIVSWLPLPEVLASAHVDAQAAYGAVILSFLGGPHWGLAMADYGGSSTSRFTRQALQNVRYIWSVMPSLVAWPALLLAPVPKFALLITSFGVVLCVDAAFAKMALVPSWYMPLRVLLTGIAMLSMTSSLIVTATSNVIGH